MKHAKRRYNVPNTTTPVFLGLIVFLEEVDLDSANQFSQLALVLAANLGEGHNSSGLLVNNGTKTSLVLHNTVRDTHLAAQSRKEDNQLDRINVISDDDESSLLRLDHSNNVVQTVLDIDCCNIVEGGSAINSFRETIEKIAD